MAEDPHRASEIVNGYDIKVTLRQLFYRLVMEELIPNKDAAYTTLSERTAQARREDGFPPLMEHGRRVRQYASWIVQSMRSNMLSTPTG